MVYGLPGLELCNGKVVFFREPKSKSSFVVCTECHLSDRQLGKINLYEDHEDYPAWVKFKEGTQEKFCTGAVQIIKIGQGKKIKLRTKVFWSFQYPDGTFNAEEVDEFCEPYNREEIISVLKNQIQTRIHLNKMEVMHRQELTKALEDYKNNSIFMNVLNYVKIYINTKIVGVEIAQK